MKWFPLGSLHGTPLIRYAIVEDGCITAVQISRPEGEPSPPPASLVFKIRRPGGDMTPEGKFNWQAAASATRPGEQPRRPVWKRAGRRVAP